MAQNGEGLALGEDGEDPAELVLVDINYKPYLQLFYCYCQSNALLEEAHEFLALGLGCILVV